MASLDEKTKIIACNLKVIMALDRQYEFKTNKNHDLIMTLPVQGIGDVKIKVIECIFMPDERFVRFDTQEDFDKWKFQKEALAAFTVTGVLSKENI